MLPRLQAEGQQQARLANRHGTAAPKKRGPAFVLIQLVVCLNSVPEQAYYGVDGQHPQHVFVFISLTLEVWMSLSRVVYFLICTFSWP